jgi:Fe-S cluster assembly protein SufD
MDAYPIVFVDGTYRPDLSQSSEIRGLEIIPLAQALGKPGVGLLHDELPSHAAVIALNTAFVTDGAVVRVAQGTELAKPILLIFARASAEGRLVTTRNILTVGVDASVCVVEAHVVLKGAGVGQDNALGDISVGEGAQLTHVKVALSGAGTHHLSTAIVRLNAGGNYRSFQFTADTAFARNSTFLTYVGEDAKADLSGVFLARGTEHIDSTLVVDHAVPSCESRELFKGVLDGRGRAVVQGKVIVRPDAQKTDGKQMAQALMLSEDAEFDSKPELEIYADDVVCGHGSTSAEIDCELLFYMRSRGLDVETARALLIESFIGEAIDKIEDEAVREAVMALAKERLASWSPAPPAKA